MQKDVRVERAQLTCVSCHRRSGWGAAEGQIVALRVAAPALFELRTSGYRRRPAYTEQTLARALREGVDPAGNPSIP